MNNLKFQVLENYPNAKVHRSMTDRWKVVAYNAGDVYEGSYRDTAHEAWEDFYDRFVAPYEDRELEKEYNLLKKQIIFAVLLILASAILLAIFSTPAKAQYRTKILNRYEYKQKFPAYQEGTRYQHKPRYSYKSKK